MKNGDEFDRNCYIVQDALTDLFKFVEDIEMCVDKYLADCGDDRLIQLAASQALNNYVQCFQDIVDAFCSDIHGTDVTLRAYIRAFYRLECDMSQEAEKVLDYLIVRNDIAHEYFRFDTLASENISKFVSYRDGFKEIAELLRGFASNNDLLEERIR